jgi:hypothetical protein
MSAEALRAALPLLRAPFTPAAVKWKVQAAPKEGKKGTAVAFIDARLVAERLNDVVGADWSSVIAPGPPVPHAGAGAYSAVCSLTVCGTTREDIGYGTHVRDAEVALKAAYSDALKRAAVHFGIGAPLYALPKCWLDPQDVRGHFLTRQREASLTESYTRWVYSPAVIERFGKPIAHGEIGPAEAAQQIAEKFDATELPPQTAAGGPQGG